MSNNWVPNSPIFLSQILVLERFANFYPPKISSYTVFPHSGWEHLVPSNCTGSVRFASPRPLTVWGFRRVDIMICPDGSPNLGEWPEWLFQTSSLLIGFPEDWPTHLGQLAIKPTKKFNIEIISCKIIFLSTLQLTIITEHLWDFATYCRLR